MTDPDLIAEVVAGSGRCAVWLKVRAQGRDLQLTVGGGEAHVGAVAVCVPPAAPGAEFFQSLAVPPPHKEGPLAQEAARRLALAGRCTCVAIVGIHLDDATRDEIAAIVANVRAGLAQLEENLAAAGQEGGRNRDDEPPSERNSAPKGAP